MTTTVREGFGQPTIERHSMHDSPSASEDGCRRYRVTIEQIPEPPEVIRDRLIELKARSKETNHHHSGMWNALALKYGFAFKWHYDEKRYDVRVLSPEEWQKLKDEDAKHRAWDAARDLTEPQARALLALRAKPLLVGSATNDKTVSARVVPALAKLGLVVRVVSDNSALLTPFGQLVAEEAKARWRW